jgi:hypothetical protein
MDEIIKEIKNDIDKLQAQIDQCIEQLDFNKINKVMIALDWKWLGSINSIPTIEELKKEAVMLLNRAHQIKGSCSCGGFEATYHKDKDYFELSFYVSTCSTQDTM